MNNDAQVVTHMTCGHPMEYAVEMLGCKVKVYNVTSVTYLCNT